MAGPNGRVVFRARGRTMGELRSIRWTRPDRRPAVVEGGEGAAPEQLLLAVPDEARETVGLGLLGGEGHDRGGPAAGVRAPRVVFGPAIDGRVARRAPVDCSVVASLP